MQSNANAETDRTPEVEPAIKHTVPWRVTVVSALPDARLRVMFVDGTAGEVEMGAFLRSIALDSTVFEALRDPVLFARAQVVLGAVQWPKGADLAPDAMYDAICERGVWVLDGMELQFGVFPVPQDVGRAKPAAVQQAIPKFRGYRRDDPSLVSLRRASV